METTDDLALKQCKATYELALSNVKDAQYAMFRARNDLEEAQADL